jgi:hypothetical protein
VLNLAVRRVYENQPDVRDGEGDDQKTHCQKSRKHLILHDLATQSELVNLFAFGFAPPAFEVFAILLLIRGVRR